MDDAPDDRNAAEGMEPDGGPVTPSGPSGVHWGGDRGHGRRERRWCIELLEPMLMNRGVAYTVHDTGAAGEAGARSWIEFTLPTRLYRDPRGAALVKVRLTVDDGRLCISAPGVYARGSLRRTSLPPPDALGNLRLLRLGHDDTSQLDLVTLADGENTAVLLMGTIQHAFAPSDVLQIAEEFAGGIDLLEFAVRRTGLRLDETSA